MRRRLAEFSGAVSLLTRLPAGNSRQDRGPPSAGVWAWPLVGAGVGGIGGGGYWLARVLAVPSVLAAVWSLVAMILVTGGFHEDGLADTADGFGGGASRERKLDIMRDSRIGTFGALALILALAIRAGAVIALASPTRVVAALVTAAALGRAAMAGMMLALAPARSDGLGAGAGRPSRGGAATALALGAAAAFALLPAPTAALSAVAAGAAAAAMSLLAWAEIGGYTGDVLGAGEQVVECVVLTLIAQQLRA